MNKDKYWVLCDKHCPHCDGTGMEVHKGKEMVCGLCDGVGTFRVRAELAHAIKCLQAQGKLP